jgi:hypothetical protein
MDLAVVRKELVDGLAAQGCPSLPIAWKWHTGLQAVDYAAPVHAHQLTPAQAHGLLQVLAARCGDDATITYDQGYLNLRFAPQTWVGWGQDWVAHPTHFIDACRLPHDLADITVFWQYRTLKVFQDAAVIANLPGWLDDERLGAYVPTAADVQGIKQLLWLGDVLQQKGNMEHKRHLMMTLIQEQVAALWQSPILVPGDAAGSAWRQALLRLCLAAAEAIGAPSKQSLAASLAPQK